MKLSHRILENLHREDRALILPPFCLELPLDLGEVASRHASKLHKLP